MTEDDMACTVQIQSIAVIMQDARAITPETIARNSTPNVIVESVRSVIPLGQTQYAAAKPIARKITAIICTAD